MRAAVEESQEPNTDENEDAVEGQAETAHSDRGAVKFVCRMSYLPGEGTVRKLSAEELRSGTSSNAASARSYAFSEAFEAWGRFQRVCLGDPCSKQEDGGKRVKLKVKLKGQGESRGTVLEWRSWALLGHHWKEALNGTVYQQLAQSVSSNASVGEDQTASRAHGESGSSVRDEVGRTSLSADASDAPKPRAFKGLPKIPHFKDAGKGRPAVEQNADDDRCAWGSRA